jgi:Optic atrophy 3 protein (OPA3)
MIQSKLLALITIIAYLKANVVERAIEAGANFLSESFIFGVAASIILAENWR